VPIKFRRGVLQEVDRTSAGNEWQSLPSVLAVGTVAWVVLFIWRVQAHQADDDDYRHGLPVRTWSVGEYAGIVVRRRGRGTLAPHLFPISTPLIQPKMAGTVVKGAVFLNRHKGIVTALSPYGWLPRWDTKGLTNGVYAIRSFAEQGVGFSQWRDQRPRWQLPEMKTRAGSCALRGNRYRRLAEFS
jgi:hypothetical protein